MRPLNLATRPFRNEALPALLRALAAVVLAALTVQHALVLRRLLPARTSALHREAAGLESDLRSLNAEAASLRGASVDPALVKQWTLLKELVDHRTFWWSGLFARLEEALPPDVRLLSVSPSLEGGRVQLKLTAAVRTVQQALDLVRTLEERPDFEDVYPESAGQAGTGRLEVAYTMTYTPPPPGAATVESSPVPSQAVAAEDTDTEEEP